MSYFKREYKIIRKKETYIDRIDTLQEQIDLWVKLLPYTQDKYPKSKYYL